MAVSEERFHKSIIDRNFINLRNRIDAVDLIDGIKMPVGDKQHIRAENEQRGAQRAAQELLCVLQRLCSGTFVEFVQALWLSPGYEDLAELLYNEVPRQYQDLFRDVHADAQQHQANRTGPRNQQQSATHVDFSVGPNHVQPMPSPDLSQQRTDLQHSDSDDQSLNCSDTSNQSVDENSVPKSMDLDNLLQGTVDELTDLLNQDELWRKLSKTVPRREVKRIGRDNKNPALALIDYLSENEWTVERFCQEVQDCVISPARERIQRILGVASPPGACGDGPRSVVQEEGTNVANIPLDSSQHKIKNITPESPESPWMNNVDRPGSIVNQNEDAISSSSPSPERIQRILGVASPPGACGDGPRSVVQEEGTNVANIPLDSSQHKIKNITPESPESPWMNNVDRPGSIVNQNEDAISSSSPSPERIQRILGVASPPGACGDGPRSIVQEEGTNVANIPLDLSEHKIKNITPESPESPESPWMNNVDRPGSIVNQNEDAISSSSPSPERSQRQSRSPSEHLSSLRQSDLVDDFTSNQPDDLNQASGQLQALDNMEDGLENLSLCSENADFGDAGASNEFGIQAEGDAQNERVAKNTSTDSERLRESTSGDESRLSGLSDTSGTDQAIGAAYFTTDNVDNDMQAEGDNDDSRPVNATRHAAVISNRSLSGDEGRLLDTSATADQVIRPSSSAASGRVDDDAPQIGQDVDDSRQGNATRQDSNDDHESEDISTGQPYIYQQQIGMFDRSETLSSSVRTVPELAHPLSLREDRSGDILMEFQNYQGRCPTFKGSDHTGAQPIMHRWSRVPDSGVVPDATGEAIGEATYSSQKTSAVEDDDVGGVVGQVHWSSPVMAAKFSGEDKTTQLKNVEPTGTNSNETGEEEILITDQNVGLVPVCLGEQPSTPCQTDQQLVDTTDEQTELLEGKGHSVAQGIGGTDEDADPSSGLVPGSFEDQTSQPDHTDQQEVDTADNGTKQSEGHAVAQGIGGTGEDADPSSGVVLGYFEDQTSHPDHTDQQEVDTADNGTKQSKGHAVAQDIGGMDEDADPSSGLVLGSFEDQKSQPDHTDQQEVDTADNGTKQSEGHAVAQGIGETGEDADPSSELVPGSFEDQTSQLDHTDQQEINTADDGTQMSEDHPVTQDIGGMDEDADSFEDQTYQPDHTDQQEIDTGTQLSEGQPVVQGISETVDGLSGRGSASEVVLDSGEDAPH